MTKPIGSQQPCGSQLDEDPNARPSQHDHLARTCTTCTRYWLRCEIVTFPVLLEHPAGDGNHYGVHCEYEQTEWGHDATRSRPPTGPSSQAVRDTLGQSNTSPRSLVLVGDVVGYSGLMRTRRHRGRFWTSQWPLISRPANISYQMDPIEASVCAAIPPTHRVASRVPVRHHWLTTNRALWETNFASGHYLHRLSRQLAIAWRSTAKPLAQASTTTTE